MFNSFGFECEFHVPDEYLIEYSKLFINSDKDNFGLDNGNLNIAEYRSNVHNNKTLLLKEYLSFRSAVKQFNANFAPFYEDNSYGIHVSFGKCRKFKIFVLFMKIFFIKHPILCLKRMFSIDWFRIHDNRTEFRLIPSLKNDSLFINFIERIENLS